MGEQTAPRLPPCSLCDDPAVIRSRVEALTDKGARKITCPECKRTFEQEEASDG